MANEDLIRGGTASVTAGQVAVTGQGVSWANVREGDFFGAHVGLAVPIAAIAGSVITLAYNWPGATQAAAAYAIQPKGDVTRFQDRVRLLVESLTNGTLAALTAAGSAANKLAYYSGAGVAALTDLSPFTRTNVLNKADRAALLATSGGIGVSEFVPSLPSFLSDMNLAVTNGFYAFSSSSGTLNRPAGANFGYLFVNAYPNGIALTQHAISTDNPRREWTRLRDGSSAWSTWVEQVHVDFMPVQQGGGVGQTTNKVRIGWSLPNKLLAQVDTLELGAIWCDQYSPYSRVGAAGYQRLPSGFIIQWGYTTAGSVTFPLSFPNSSMCVVPQILTTNATLLMWSVVVASNTNGGFTVNRRVTGGGGGAVADTGEGYSWIAIGY